METLMIHNVRKEFFQLDLAPYRLSFDDGLFSQYYYLPLFERMENPRLYLIATGFIGQGKRRARFDGRHLPFVKSRRYMYRAIVEKNFDQFMNLDELKAVADGENVVIGVHSHFHDVVLAEHPPKKPVSRWKIARVPVPDALGGDSMNRRSKLAFRGFDVSGGRLVRRSRSQWEEFVRYDTESCLEWFEKKLGFQPEDYGFPFNEYTPELIEILKGYGFKNFYNGRSGDGMQIVNRIDIDSMIDD